MFSNELTHVTNRMVTHIILNLWLILFPSCSIFQEPKKPSFLMDNIAKIWICSIFKISRNSFFYLQIWKRSGCYPRNLESGMMKLLWLPDVYKLHFSLAVLWMLMNALPSILCIKSGNSSTSKCEIWFSCCQLTTWFVANLMSSNMEMLDFLDQKYILTMILNSPCHLIIGYPTATYSVICPFHLITITFCPM